MTYKPQFIDGTVIAFTCGGTVPVGSRVKIVTGEILVAGVGADDELLEVGTAFKSGVDGDVIPVVPRNAQGVVMMIADAAIAGGVAVYGAADGKVSETVSGAPLGVTVDASAADEDPIPVLRQ
jgi:hypothetical protein